MSLFLSHPQGKGLYGIFNDSFPPIIDGVTLTVENYAYWLNEMGRTPCIVTPWNPQKTDSPYHLMRFLSLPIHNRHPYRYGYPKLDPFIWNRLRNTDFKILHSHCPFSSGRLAVYVKKHQHIPLIGTFHSKYREDLKHSFRHMHWCVPIIMNRILNFLNACDEVWIPQASVEETVREYGYKGPLTVVENGNDFAPLAGSQLKEIKEKAKSSLGFKKEDFNMLFVGQHIWEKGIGMIIETIDSLRNNPHFKMTFIGTGYAQDDLIKEVKKKNLGDRITFTGVMTDREKLKQYYAASDLFLFPSFYDNAPLVVREAAAMGTPAVLLKGSTASEVIVDDKNGFLIDNDVKDFGNLLSILEKDRDRVIKAGENARETLVRSWKDVVEEVIDRYDSLLKRFNKS